MPGFTTPLELAVLRLAASLLPPDEAYLEVGTFKGRSTCAAALDASGGSFYAVEAFTEFGMVAGSARAELRGALDRWAPGGRVHLLDGDCFDLLARRHALDLPVGVYFYDGAHTGLAHYLALGVAEPLLADEALVLVDDATWPMVADATARYLARHPGWDVLHDFRADRDDDPRWANGLLVLRFRRPAGATLGMAPDVRWRRHLQVRLRGPATSLVWHSLHRFPGLVPFAKRLAPSRSRRVRPAD